MQKGTYKLHDEANFNFQLNRIIMWGDGDLNELREISKKIITTEDWVNEFTQIAQKSERNNEIAKTISYYRMAEFFEFEGSPNKEKLYNQSKKLFYSYNKEIFEKDITIDYVEYENSKMPVWICRPKTEIIDTIVLHGGNDSYIEEFLPIVQYLMQKGFAIYLFDGPGQGTALRTYNLYFTHKWEKPVGAILDKYNLNDVTLVGLSLGGMLAPRAAAFEKRIKRVFAWGIMPSLYDVLLSKSPSILNTLMLLKQKRIVNFLMRAKMKREPIAKWAILHGIYSMNVKTPYDYVKRTKDFEMKSIGTKIKQDFMLAGACEDHFIPVRMYKDVIHALPNVKSLSFRLFTKFESAENHCSIGNTELVLKNLIEWIKIVK
jgi:esterase/lipase